MRILQSIAFIALLLPAGLGTPPEGVASGLTQCSEIVYLFAGSPNEVNAFGCNSVYSQDKDPAGNLLKPRFFLNSSCLRGKRTCFFALKRGFSRQI